jgi:hypothetical protein
MRVNLLAFAVVAAGLLAMASPATAHHAWRLDRSRLLNLKGTVTSFAFSNPHVQIYFDVQDANGNIENWSAGGASPNRLSRSGWTRETLKPGEEVTVTGHRSSNGSNVLRFDSVALADGQPIGGYRAR